MIEPAQRLCVSHHPNQPTGQFSTVFEAERAGKGRRAEEEGHIYQLSIAHPKLRYRTTASCMERRSRRTTPWATLLMKLEESSRSPLGLELSESLVGWRWVSKSSLPIDPLRFGGAGGIVVGSCSGGADLLHREEKETGIACFPGLLHLLQEKHTRSHLEELLRSIVMGMLT